MSKIIRTIILDDEQLAIDTLQWQINEFTNNIIVEACFTNPLEAKEFIERNNIDLCFLDIDMPEMNGFEFLKLWNNRPPFDFIFTTAYAEYAIQAFKVSATNYLLKPVDEDDLIETLETYRNTKNKIDIEEQLQILSLQLEKPKSFSDRIALPTLEGIHMVDIANIIRLQASNNYTTIFLTNSPSIIVSRTLKEVEKVLSPDRFFRIHQTHTIDIKKIKLYQRGRGGTITLLDGTLLPVSKGKKDALIHRLGLSR